MQFYVYEMIQSCKPFTCSFTDTSNESAALTAFCAIS